jgi:hypothetical protein
MAINYNVGYLPQSLYDNIGNAYADQIRNRNERRMRMHESLADALGAVAGAYAKKGDKSLENFKKQYETQREEIKEQMKFVDPRDKATMQAFNDSLKNLDEFYNKEVSRFENSGFLGSRFGRDIDQLESYGQDLLSDYGVPSINPEGTKAAYALADDQTKYLNKMETDFKMAPQIEGAKRTAGLTSEAEFSQSELGKAVQNAEDNRALALEKKKLALAVEADIQKRGGTYKDVAIALEKIRNAKSPEELALKRDEMISRRDLMNTEYTNKTALENLRFENDQKRYQLQNEYATGQPAGGMTFSQYSNAKNVIKNGYKNDPNLNSKIMSGELTESDLDAMADQEVRARYEQFQNFKNSSSAASPPELDTPEQPKPPVAPPSAADLGFTPPPGQGFISQDALNNLDLQTIDLGNRLERLQDNSGKSMFPELQKKSDQLIVRADQFYKELTSANTPEEKRDAVKKLNQLAKEIYQVSKELEKKEMESGSFRGLMRKAGKALGWE